MSSDINGTTAPDILEKVARLEMKARMVVEGLLSGMHKSPYRGFNVEFLEHRQYNPGDDIRYMDWKLYGKRDKLFIKQFEEDTNLRAYLLLDSSASMKYGSGGHGTKLEYASLIAACLGYLFVKQGDAAGLVAFGKGVMNSVEPKSGRAQLYRLLNSLESNPGGGETDVAGALATLGEQIKRRSFVVLISDLLAEPEPVIERLKILRSRQSEMVIFSVLDRDEVEFPFTRASRFIDVETGAALAADPSAIRREYRRNLNRHFALYRSFCARHAIEFVSAVTDEPIEKVLLGWIQQRERRKRSLRSETHESGGGADHV